MIYPFVCPLANHAIASRAVCVEFVIARARFLHPDADA